MCAKPQLNQVWSGKALENKTNEVNHVYTNMGIVKLFTTQLSFFDFVLKGNIAYNKNGLVRTVHGFTHAAMRAPIEPNTHLIARYYATPGKKNYKITNHYKFRTTISENKQDWEDIEDYQELIAQQIQGVHIGEQQLMQYIFLKMFVGDEHIKKLGLPTANGADPCGALIPETLALYEPTDGSTKGNGQYQNFRTLEEVAGNWDNTNNKFKDWGVKSTTDLKPDPKIVKTNALKAGLEVIHKALIKNEFQAVALESGVHKNINDATARKILGMFLTAVNMRDDMCGPVPTGKYTIGTTCMKDGKCTADDCACCLPSNFAKDEIIILANTGDYRKYRDYVVKDALYSGVSGEFEGMLSSNNIHHDARLEPGYIYVLHKEAINIWITRTSVEGDMYKEFSIHNTWFDRDMYIGHWCFLPAVRIKQLA